MADPEDFELDPRLVGDTLLVGDFPLARVLLMDDARFPWLVLVPRMPGLIELGDLPREQRIALLDEVDLVAGALRDLVAPDKLNIAALGNVVAQLHVHVIARFRTDPAWPRPVWCVGRAQRYAPDLATARVRALRERLDLTTHR